MVTKTRLSEALDAAGLAVGTNSGLTHDQQVALAQKYFDANYPHNAIGVPGPVAVSSSGQTLSLSVNASVPTTLLGVAHIQHLDLSVTNQIVYLEDGDVVDVQAREVLPSDRQLR